MNEDLRGVGGWLAFFVFVMAVLSPIGTIILVLRDLYGDPMIAASYGELWGTIQLFEWSHTAITILGSWFIAWRLVNVENRLTVTITIAGIWLIAIGGVITELLGVALIAGLPLGDLIAASMRPEMIRPLIFCIIWTSYFLVSRRVKNTYLSGDEQAEVFE